MKFKMTPLERKWVWYDVGNSAFTLLVSTLIPIFFSLMDGGETESATTALGYATSIATAVVAILGPILGSLSDLRGMRKVIFMGSVLVGALGCVALGFMQHWLWFLVLLVIAKSAYQLSLVVYDSMLCDITQRELDLLEKTVDALLLAQGDTAFTVRFYPKTALAAALESDEIDFVFTDPSVFASLEGHFGLRAITSIFPQESSSPETVSAAALIVAEASPLRTLHDVSGKPIFVLEGFLSSLLKFDLQEQGYDTKSFFSNLKPSVATVEEAVSQVLAHPECKSEVLELADFTDKVVLDVGAGSGRLAFAAARKAKSVYASEPVDRLREFMRDKIRKEGIQNVTVLDGTCDRLPYEDNTFDIVMSGHVVGDDYEKELGELTRVVKNGGWILDCPGEDDRQASLKQELLERGFEYFYYKSRNGGDVYRYRKQIFKNR